MPNPMALALFFSAALLAYANGANDNFKAVATLYGAGVSSFRRSLWLATAAQIAGSLASVVLSGVLLKAFTGEGLVPPEIVTDPVFMTSVGLGAAGAVLLATAAGLPVSTTHALVGGLAGAGLVLSPAGVAWSQLGRRFLAPLLVSPLLALAAAGGLYPLARRIRLAMGIEAETCLCLEEGVQVVEVGDSGQLMLARTGLALTVDQQRRCERRYRGEVAGLSAQGIADALHRASGFALGFARGLNDTPKILALLLAARWSGLPTRQSLALLAGVMALGGLLHARRVAETLSHKITGMNRGQGLLANAVSSLLVIGASLAGSPVSTTHVSAGAIFGIGMHTGTANPRVIAGVALAWVATLPLAAGLAAAAAVALAG